MSQYNEDTDRRHVRRELTPEEMTYLLAHVENSDGENFRLSGPVRGEADRFAAKWEEELRAGIDDRRAGRTPWETFRHRYEDEVLSGLAAATDRKTQGVFNTYERLMHPRFIGDVTTDKLGQYQQRLRDESRAETTIKGHLAHLAAALRWAAQVGFLPSPPKIPKTHRARVSRVMKGRPITREELERMIDKTPDVVGPERATSWQHLIIGLWWSGLRLAESLELHWTDDTRLCVDLSCRHPMLRIPAALEKGNKDRLLPVAPEFAEFLLATPEARRVGFVFNPEPDRHRHERIQTQQASRLISRIGEAANVKVSGGGEDAPVKFASAHDLRRSFGDRWAVRVMPQVLMELMRHESIQTTMRYYVGRSAQATAGVLWDAYRKTQERVSSDEVAAAFQPTALPRAGP